MLDTRNADSIRTQDSLEGLLAEVESTVSQVAHALLFTGEELRLQITLHRRAESGRLRWGIRDHEEWAFKATLLRFARGTDPVHLVIDSERNGTHETQGWVVKRTLDTFWASRLATSQALVFKARHLVSSQVS